MQILASVFSSRLVLKLAVVVAAMVSASAAARAQVGLASQSRVVQVFDGSGTYVQSAPTFGVWNQVVGFGGPSDNACTVQSNVAETTIRMNGTSTVWGPGNVTSSSPVAVNANIAFNLFSQASFSLTVGDALGIRATANFTLTGPGGVVASGRTINIAAGTLLPGAYTLTYNFTHNYGGFASAGAYGFTLDFTGFQPGPSAITYQGKIDNAGTPANEPYNVAFFVYAEPSGGSPIVFGQEQTNVPVTNGVFTTTFDFGDALWETMENRWLEVAVRPTAGTGQYTTLTPRQRIGAAPRAIYANKAAVAAIAQTATGIDLLSRGLVRGEAGASSNSPGLIFATPVGAPISRSFVGMADDNNVGFYGYAGGGWSLTTRTDTGRVGIGTLDPNAKLEVAGAVRATSFDYPTSQVRSRMVTFTEFRCEGNANAVINSLNLGVAGPNNTSTPIFAVVSVPEGSQLQDVTIYFRDQEPGANLRFEASIYNQSVPNRSTLTGLVDLTASQSAPLTRNISLAGSSPTSSDTMIVLQFFPVDGVWNLFNSLNVQGVRINYTVSGPR